MGNRPQNLIAARLLLAAVLLPGACVGVGAGDATRPPAAADAAAAPDPIRETAMTDAARDYLLAFRRGDAFSGSPTDLLADDGRPDAGALALFALELVRPETGSDAREEIVRLLSELARIADPLTAAGAEVLRDAGVVELLAGPALDRPDPAADLALERLLDRTPPAALAPVADRLAEALLARPDSLRFLVVAKAKPTTPALRSEVLKLADSLRWRDTVEARIARAALGDRTQEAAFLAALAAAERGSQLVAAIGPLARIGTPAALAAVAGRLRSPWVIEIQGSLDGRHVKSVRLEVLAALARALPDEPALMPNNIHQDADYRAAEAVCEARLGVHYTEPAPPFLKYATSPR